MGTGALLISERHRRLYQDYYSIRDDFQPRPNQWLSRVEQLAHRIHARSIIDYGCGCAHSIAGFSALRVTEYDPGIPWLSAVPKDRADLVVSIHALEHVEPDYIDVVIDHMLGLATKAVLIVASCEPSTKTLPDGSAWHSFVRDAKWWRSRLSDFKEQPTIKSYGLEYAALKLCGN